MGYLRATVLLILLNYPSLAFDIASCTLVAVFRGAFYAKVLTSGGLISFTLRGVLKRMFDQAMFFRCSCQDCDSTFETAGARYTVRLP